VRDARQELAEGTLAKNAAYTARLQWTGLPGVLLSATAQYQSDFTQGLDPTAGSARLFEVNVAFNRGPFKLRALHAPWDLEGSGPAAVGADKQVGWYVEPSFRLSERWGVFVRYNQ
jgi:hypothetical protein